MTAHCLYCGPVCRCVKGANVSSEENADDKLEAVRRRFEELTARVNALESTKTGKLRRRAQRAEARIAELEAELKTERAAHLLACRNINLALDQCRAAESALAAATANDIRAAGWALAVHNDYRLHGEAHTFWLFTKDGQAVKGEGKTDSEALSQIRAALTPAAEPRPKVAPGAPVACREFHPDMESHRCYVCGMRKMDHPFAPLDADGGKGGANCGRTAEPGYPLTDGLCEACGKGGGSDV